MNHKTYNTQMARKREQVPRGALQLRKTTTVASPIRWNLPGILRVVPPHLVLQGFGEARLR